MCICTCAQALNQALLCAQLEWNHTLTLHTRSRKFPSKLAHAETTRVLAGLAAIVRGEGNPFKEKVKVTASAH